MRVSNLGSLAWMMKFRKLIINTSFCFSDIELGGVRLWGPYSLEPISRNLEVPKLRPHLKIQYHLLFIIAFITGGVHTAQSKS